MISGKNVNLAGTTHTHTHGHASACHVEQSIHLVIKSYPVVLVYALPQLFDLQKQIIAGRVSVNQNHLCFMPVSVAIIALLCFDRLSHRTVGFPPTLPTEGKLHMN